MSEPKVALPAQVRIPVLSLIKSPSTEIPEASERFALFVKSYAEPVIEETASVIDRESSACKARF